MMHSVTDVQPMACDLTKKLFGLQVHSKTTKISRHSFMVTDAFVNNRKLVTTAFEIRDAVKLISAR